MKAIIFIVITISIFPVYSEIIDGPANIRTAPGGDKLILLYDSVEVSCTEIKNDWCRIGLLLLLTEEQYKQKVTIIPTGSKLYNTLNEIVGETITDLKLTEKSTGSSPGKAWYDAEFVGYTHKANIKPESIPEIRLSEILNENKEILTKSMFDSYMKRYGFDDFNLLGRIDSSYSEFFIHDSWITDPSPRDRIRLIFKSSKLIAIVHTRKLFIDNPKPIDLIFNNKISIFFEMSKVEMKKFIELNREAYQGVD